MESSFYKANSHKRKRAPQVFQRGGHAQFKSELMALCGTGTTLGGEQNPQPTQTSDPCVRQPDD